MAFTISRTTSARAADAWAALTDLAEHTRHVPLTEVVVPDAGLVLGAEVVARTGLGPIGFADRMLVTAIEPGTRLRMVKTGLWLRGWAEITVTDTASGSAGATTAAADTGSGAHVTWVEELWLPGLRRLTTPLGDRLGPLLFARVVDGLLAAAAAEGDP